MLIPDVERPKNISKVSGGKAFEMGVEAAKAGLIKGALMYSPGGHAEVEIPASGTYGILVYRFVPEN